MSSGRLIATACVLAAAAPAIPSSGWPLIGAAQQIGELRCYPDHAEPSLWWYVPNRLELATVDGRPGFSFDRYRYTGTALTGDQGEFWGRGVLSFEVRFAPAPDRVAQARSEIERRSRRRAVLQPVPLDRVDSTVIYASAGESSVSGELRGGSWSDRGEVWTERTYEIGLSPASAESLWQVYHDDGLAVSLGYSLIGQGVRQRGGGDAEEEAEPAPETVVFAGGALPIRVSPSTCPECFASIDLDARIAAEYPFLEVYCYDFESAAAPTDLGLTVVRGTLQDEPRLRVRRSPGSRLRVPGRPRVRRRPPGDGRLAVRRKLDRDSGRHRLPAK